MAKLTLFDTNCLAHKAVRIAAKHNLDADSQQLYYSAVLMWADSLGFVPKLRDRTDLTSCWLTDAKPYWRSTYKPDYKGVRDRTEETIQSLDLFHQCFDLLDLPVLKIPQYEADDIAGAIVKLWQAVPVFERKFDKLFLVTLDSDWQGLVVDDSVAWLNMLTHEPRVRRRAECYQWLVKDYNKASKHKKKRYELPGFAEFSSTDIWEWKGSSGDKSDNIAPEEGHWLTDLFNQPDRWNLAHHSQFQLFGFVTKNTHRSVSNWFEAEQAIHAMALPLPIEPIII